MSESNEEMTTAIEKFKSVIAKNYHILGNSPDPKRKNAWQNLFKAILLENEEEWRKFLKSINSLPQKTDEELKLFSETRGAFREILKVSQNNPQKLKEVFSSMGQAIDANKIQNYIANADKLIDEGVVNKPKQTISTNKQTTKISPRDYIIKIENYVNDHIDKWYALEIQKKLEHTDLMPLRRASNKLIKRIEVFGFKDLMKSQEYKDFNEISTDYYLKFQEKVQAKVPPEQIPKIKEKPTPPAQDKHPASASKEPEKPKASDEGSKKSSFRKK